MNCRKCNYPLMDTNIHNSPKAVFYQIDRYNRLTTIRSLTDDRNYRDAWLPFEKKLAFKNHLIRNRVRNKLCKYCPYCGSIYLQAGSSIFIKRKTIPSIVTESKIDKIDKSKRKIKYRRFNK